MGDGGVTFAPSQHLMERFPTSESFCGANGGFNSKSLQFSDSSPEPENKMEVEKGDIVSGESLGRKVEKQTRLEVEKGEIILEKCPKSEIENGEIVVESSHSRRWELEKGEIVPENWRKGELKQKKSRRGEERAAPARKGELEKGEFVPEKCRSELGRVLKGEVVKEEFSSGKARKWQLERGETLQQKGRKDRERYSTEDVLLNRKNPPSSSRWDPTRETEISRSSTERRKRTSSRWDPAHEREPKKILRADEELRSYKKDYTRKYHGDYSDHYGLKGRKISEDNNLSTHPEKVHSPSPVERSYRNSSSRVSSSSRYASRHNDFSHSGKGARDRHCRSPDHSERSPHERPRHHDHKDRSPERSSYDQVRHSDQRRKSPGYLEKSPHDRLRRHGHRDRSPGHLEPSPRDRSRQREYKNSTPQRSPNHHRRAHDSSLQRSPRDQGRTCDYRETKLKNGGSERSQGRQEEKLGRRDLDGKDSQRNTTARHSHNSSNCTKNVENQSHKEKEQQNPTSVCSELPQVNEAPEELASMEEDMDICDTPPHVPVVADLNLGKWFYLDSYGMERGPSKLCDVRKLVEEGALQSDHLIKHSASDRWVTVENAASPLVLPKFPSIVSDAVTELANPPEAPGNLLVDFGDVRSPGFQHNQDEISVESLSFEDLHIDERVESLMRGYTFIIGRELETVGEALNVTFEHVEWEKWGNSEGFTRFRRAGCDEIYGHPRDEDLGRGSDMMPKENAETRLVAPFEDYPKLSTDLSDWFGSLWSCKGGDWKRNDEVAQDRSLRKKLVLNEGYPLCQMLKSGYDDPRRNRKDELYPPSRSKKLDLPPWAFSLSDEKIETNGSVRVSQVKSLVVRGVKGTVLPVVRINACVIRDHGPVVCDLRVRHRSSDRHASSRSRSFSASSDSKSTSTEVGISRSRKVQERDSSQGLLKCRTVINTPKDRICTADELELNFGDWYYLDGAGHEQGPAPFSELQNMAFQGVIQKHSSVFRKMDKVWVPITAATASEASKTQGDKAGPSADSSTAFHNSHPQFIGFTRGKLHELVMKSYRSREFAAAINEVLDPWISTKQTKKEMDKHFPFISSFTKNSALLSQELSAFKFQKSEDDFIRSGKRARSQFDESDVEDEMDEDSVMCHKHDVLFDDLCGEAAIDQEEGTVPVTKTEGWGQLNVRILARIFHFLRTDLKSLAFSAATCKCWNIAVKFYRGISRHIEFSSDGVGCTDSMLRNIMSGYERATIRSIVLTGCTNVSSGTLEEVLRSFASISSVDIRGCNQFRQLQSSFKDVKWIKSRGSSNNRTVEESHSKIRSLKQITDRSYLNSKIYKGSSSHFDDSEVVRDSFEQGFILDGKDPAGHAFRQGCYKRRKLFGARKASAVLSRDAHMRRWLCRKSEDEYKKMEEFLAVRLKEIMKENSFNFFVPKVAEIEDRMRNGYYVGHGLGSFKEDISRMCRDAIKAKNRGDTGDMNHIIMSFIQLVTSLEENSKSSSHERDEMMKNLKDGPGGGFPFTHSKYKKKNIKVINERKGMRSNGTSYVNGGTDYREYASDREIRRRLNKLNRKPLNSESETSDDLGPSEEDGGRDDETTSSDTESDLDFHSGSGTGERRGDGLPFNVEERLDSTADDREWGARMTKASLVPPVTRKYEVIDSYVIVADEEVVQRKMRVSLPDNYAELRAQKTSNEEADMDFPEVKDYKPRKKLGDEVLEQEVYGIDPYTHNLLLDSMPEESAEWPLSERHVFIEEVLLRELNKQVRHFTGTGNTPMMYPLRSVVEDIQKTAEDNGNRRNMRTCQSILKAMQNRPDDNYVAYRKGLGVVCNKEEGFGEDDFVVEFLGEVYPAWKWFEKQDGIRSLQKNSKDPAPEFYNIYLERPKGDRDGYDLVVVDAMHKANYASRICHSCRPNCEAKVTAVDGQYQIGIYAVRSIGYGEEITFDYNSVTESKEEYEASVCLCGSQVCRGSYLNLTGEGAFQKVLKECHGILDRHNLMLEACKLNSVSKQDYIDLGRAGLGQCLLSGLPDWLIAYSARLVRFINYERTKLPEEILNYNLEEKRKFFSDISIEVEKSEAEIQAEGVYNQRLQNLALTLDKVRYVMRCIFGDPKTAPPPLERLAPEALVSILWKGKDSLVEELLQCIAPHIEDDLLNNLKFKIRAHDPSGSDDLERDLRKSLLWLRDEIRDLPCSYKCRHDAAADLIHIYAYTECFFKVRNYKTVTSEPVYISPLDLGPKYADKMGPGFQEYRKTYSENYCLGQLIYWHNQANADPDRVLARARRGCLSLPDVASFYARSQKPLRRHVYGPRTLKFMLARMDKQPQRQWPKDRIWQFKSSPQIFGSPMLDAVLNKSTLDKEMVHWLKSRLSIFQATWDR